MAFYVVYDTKDNDLPVIVGDIYEIAHWANKSLNCLRSSMSKGFKIKGRYLVERVE